MSERAHATYLYNEQTILTDASSLLLAGWLANTAPPHTVGMY